MFKKKLLTVAALAFCAAIVTAQTKGTGYPTSRVKATTVNLIEDDVIDSLPFGNEEGKGVLFGQYASNGSKIELGWGNAFGDALWLSIYDGIWLKGDETKTESVTKKYGYAYNGESVNVDYVDEDPRKTESGKKTTTTTNSNGTTTSTTEPTNNFKFQNDFAVGVGINNTIGIQALWSADWTEKKDVVAFKLNDSKDNLEKKDYWELKNETTNSSTGKTTSEEYGKVKNFTRNNVIAFSFRGIGIENDGEVPFFVNLKNVYSSLNFDTKSNNYSSTTAYLSSTQESITADGINQTITIRPGLTAEAGFNLANWGIAKPTISFTEQFSIGFDIVKNKTNFSKTTEKIDTRETTDTTTEYTPGKKLNWRNTLTPALTLDFDILDQLTLKTQVAAGISLAQNNTAAGKTKTVTTNTTYTKATGLSDVTTTTTEAAADGNKNTKSFTTTVSPAINLGLVYQVIPGKTNINFGVNVNPGSYTWKTTETTNANINKVVTTEKKDTTGNTKTSTTVTVNNNSTEGAAETRETSFSNSTGTTGKFGIGATWFFTENAKFDVSYSAGFDNVFGTSAFGVDFAVMF